MPCFPLLRRSAAVVLACAFLTAPGLLAAKRPITETDLFQFVWIADPQISPDGSQIAYVRVTVDKKKTGYETALWIVGTDGKAPARPLTAGPRDNSPRWSPDGSRLAFTRVGKDEAGKPADPQVHVLSLQGGEAVAVTEMPEGAAAHAWSPDGRTIAFASGANEKDLAQKKDKEGKGKDDEEYESDVRVVSQATFRFDGGGYADFTRPMHVWTVAVPAPGAKPAEPKQITTGVMDDGAPKWSPDGSLLYFVADHVKEAYYARPDADLYAVPAAGGAVRRVLSIDGPIGDFNLSPDGRRVAFDGFSHDGKSFSYNQPDLFVADLATGQAKNLSADYDFDIGAGLVGDQHPPRGGRPLHPVWSQDGRSVLAVSGERGRVNLLRFDAAAGTRQPVTKGDHEVVSYTATPDGSRLAVVLSTPTVITDLYVLDAASGRLTPLVRPNEELFSQLDLTEPEEFTYKSFDGREVPTLVQKPPGFDPAKKYPLILDIHGGPHAAHGFVFFHEVQWWAAQGYVVLYPNPRGSSTYGQEFGNVIQYDFPGDDAKDLLAGVDAMLARGSIDPKKLGVTGGSGGGILTNWIVTQTGRFAAAVSQRSIADWTNFWYTADFTLFTPFWFRGAPWEQPADFARRSPITHIAKVTTPLMLIEGEIDYRTPPAAGGELMFRALKYLKRPVAMVRFPGEGHDLSRTGQPWHRIERLRHIKAWFDKYLKGEKIDTYDVP